MPQAETMPEPPDGEASERRLVEDAQRDPRCFAALYERHFERVYAYVARRVRERAEAEDLTAEVFHQALANLPRFEWRGLPFTAWLFRIAANAIIDRAKRAARESGVEVAELPALTPNMEEIEEQARAFRLVDHLPADQRRVMLMRFAEDRTTREIAQALARSEGAIKQLQFRGLQNLRAMLGERDG